MPTPTAEQKLGWLGIEPPTEYERKCVEKLRELA